MKRILIVSIYWFVALSAFRGTSQQVLDPAIRFSNASYPISLSDFLDTIELQAEVFFVYSTNSISPSSLLDPQQRNLSLSQALQTLENQLELNWIRQDDRIILMRNFTSDRASSGVSSISGMVRDALTDEYLIGATIYFPSSGEGTVSDNKGFFEFLPEEMEQDSFPVVISYVGYRPVELKIPKGISYRADFLLYPDARFEEVLILGLHSIHGARKPGSEGETGTQPGYIPGALGAADLFRGLALLPGINRGNDLQPGLSVRGMAPGANHYLVDGFPIYEPNHALGLFPVFHEDMVRLVDVYKQGIPLEFGGRTGAVVNHLIKTGNAHKRKWSVGWRPSAVTLGSQGPLTSGKNQYFAQTRISLLDVFLPTVIEAFTPYRQASTRFEDLAVKISQNIDPTRSLELLVFLTSDRIGWAVPDNINLNETRTSWKNQLLGLSYTSLAGKAGKHHLQAGISRYSSRRSSVISPLDIEKEPYFQSISESAVEEWFLKYQGEYRIDNTLTFSGGGRLANNLVQPSLFRALAGNVTEFSQTLESPADSLSREVSVFASLSWKPVPNFSLEAGTQSNLFFSGSEQPVWLMNPVLTSEYTFLQHHRIGMGVQRMYQHLHLLENRQVGATADLWLPSSVSLPSEKAWQVFLEYGFAIPAGLNIEAIVFYRWLQDLVDYRSVSEQYDPVWNQGLVWPLFANAESWEDRVSLMNGKSWGFESTLSWQTSDWAVSLAYSRIMSRFWLKESSVANPFPGSYDFPNSIHFFMQYRISHSFDVFLGWQYHSGSYFSLPQDRYLLPGDVPIVHFSGRNNAQMPDYHALRAGATYEKQTRTLGWKLEFGVNNMYNRANPLFMYLADVDGQLTLKQIDGFPVLPYVQISLDW